MNKRKIFLALSVLALSSLLVVAQSARAEEDSDSVAGRERGEVRSQENRSLVRSDDETKDKDASSTLKGERDESESELHRSVVASFVQNLLKMADRRRDGIGEKVREVAKEQRDNVSSTIKAIKETEERNGLKTFLIGTDYKNIGAIRSAIARTQNQLEQLDKAISKMATSTEKKGVVAQIQALKEQQTKLNDFVKSKEDTFSLFGWFVKLFN